MCHSSSLSVIFRTPLKLSLCVQCLLTISLVKRLGFWREYNQYMSNNAHPFGTHFLSMEVNRFVFHTVCMVGKANSPVLTSLDGKLTHSSPPIIICQALSWMFCPASAPTMSGWAFPSPTSVLGSLPTACKRLSNPTFFIRGQNLRDTKISGSWCSHPCLLPFPVCEHTLLRLNSMSFFFLCEMESHYMVLTGFLPDVGTTGRCYHAGCVGLCVCVCII